MVVRKHKLLTAKINDDLEQAIINRCNSLGCNKSEYIKTLIQSDIAEWESTKNKVNPMEKNRQAYSEPYDIEDERSGCIDRYRSDGTLMFHFVPIENEKGVQLYRDALSNNPRNTWYRDDNHRWISRIRIH